MSSSAAPTKSLSPAAAAASASAQAAAAIAHAIKHKGEHEYPFDIWYFIAATTGVAVALNVFSVVWAFWRRQTLRKGPVTPKESNNNGHVSLSRVPAAVLTATRIIAFRVRLPVISLNVLEAFMTAMYTMALLIWEFANTQNLVINNWSDRSGHIAACQIPLIVGLSMKNNVIGYLTGFSHEKLHVFHRTVARSVLIIVWIHGWSRVTVAPADIVALGWRILGLTAGLVYTIIVMTSWKPIRTRFFEIFYVSHFTLVLLFLILVYLHCNAAGPFGIYVWPSFVIWGFDRVCRYIRYLILTDFRSPTSPASQAEVELIDHDTLRVTARRRMLLGWTAGAHMYLALPTLGPIESHPFTIATVSDDGEGSSDGKEMVWVIRARDGFTRRLKEYALANNGSCRMPVFMHGPYGAPPDITPYSTCVFIAGGSGVTYTLPRMRDLLIRASKGNACAKRVVFVWAVRHSSHINWLSAEITKALSTAASCPYVSFSLAIYVTGTGDKTLDDGASTTSAKDVEREGSFDEKSSGEKSGLASPIPGVELIVGRPDVGKVLEEAVRTSTGPVSVDVSGPELLVSAVRESLSGSYASPLSVLKGAPTVQLNVEKFSI